MTMDTLWLDSLSAAAGAVRSSAIRDLLTLIERPEVISFAGGLPAPQCFPTEELTAATERALTNTPLDSLQYGPTEGYRPLRELLAARMAHRGMPVSCDEVLITSGSQQALDLLGRLLIDEGAPVLVEEPTYLGALQAWRPCRPHFVSLPMDADGLMTDALEDVLRSGLRPRFLYTVSSFQNPTGVTMALHRRKALIELAARYRLPIIEDDPYGALRYSGEHLPTLAALDIAAHGELRHVVYLSTFSKILAPGLRIGWMVVPNEIGTRLTHSKQGFDLHTSSIGQVIAFEAARDGVIERHLPTIIAIYQQRRDTMLASLAAQMPPDVTWTRPDGGMFLWLTLPATIDCTDLLQRAVEQDVAFVPGASFHTGGGGTNTMRLNFSYPAPDRIREGVARLATVLRM